VSRFHTENVFVWREARDRTETHRAGDIFLVDLPRTILQSKQRRSLGGPDNPIAIAVILERACAGGIADEVKNAEKRIPERETEVAY
jgi:hypothetical protein